MNFWVLEPLSYRRLVEAKAIKLGPCDKHPAIHTASTGMSIGGIFAMKILKMMVNFKPGE